MRASLFGAGLHAKSANVCAQSRVNCFAELQPIEDKTKITFYGTAGLDPAFVDQGDTPTRGMIVVGDFLYQVHRENFWEVNNAGISTLRGTLNTSSGRVDMRFNGTQILILDGVNGYYYTVATTTLAVITDPDFPDAASSCAWDSGYALVANGREFGPSAPDDVTAWDATERANAESNPDEIVRIMESRNEIHIFGPTSYEPWAINNNQDFPYGRVGGGTSDFGLAAKYSLVPYDGTIAGLFQNSAGDVQVGVLNGYKMQPISDANFESEINGYDTVSDCTALAYRYSGHSFAQFNFPTAGKSWLYDSHSGLFSELRSSGGRHRAEIAVIFINRIVVSDYENGKLYRLNPEAFTDAGEEMEMEMVSRHLFNDKGDYFSIGKLWIDMETGVGTTTGQGSAPVVMVYYSKDGGKTFGNERTADMGPLGLYKTRAYCNRFGRARDGVVKIRITDPVKRAIIGEGYIS